MGDQEKIKEGINSKDSLGNTVLHTSYKCLDNEILNSLYDMKIGDDNELNLRGLVPKQMNHKRVKLNQMNVDDEPDYLFVVKNKRADYIRLQLSNLSVIVKEFPCMFLF